MDKTENPFLTTIRLPVKKSRILHLILMVVHIICLILPWMTGLALYNKMILMCVPVISFCFYLNGQGKNNNKKAAMTLILNSGDSWQVKMNDGTTCHAELGQSLFVHPWLTIIFLIFDKRREVFIFTPEILDADQFRRLRVRLRFKVCD
ncbi:MAG: hypothetical protein HND53_00890 [Proteobacteria bacterium]|nr:hypothetical protein [Pseudomonadota bacterium]NOG59029.1 hypothetical protein [Pseudomonadota bacterium]